MDIVKSTKVLPHHLDPGRPVLIELELAAQFGDSRGIEAALLSPALAAELRDSLSAHPAVTPR